MIPPSLAAIDEEIKRISQRIESIQKEEALYETKQIYHKADACVIQPKYSSLTDLKNIQVPKGFERAPITHNYDPEKALKLSAVEESLRKVLVDKNRENLVSLVRRIQINQSQTTGEKTSDLNNINAPAQTHDELRDRFLSQWSCSGY